MTEVATVHVRRQPSQGRSAQRFELILDTMATLIDEVGYRSITISMIAKRSNMSGPAVYRYFDDVQSITRELAARNLTRFVDRASAAIRNEQLEWPAPVITAIEILAEMHRREPGFRWLRLGDAIDRNLIDASEPNLAIVSRLLKALFIARYGDFNRPNLLKHIEALVEMAEALVAKAFETDPHGDEFFISEAGRVVTMYLDEYIARPPAEA